MEEQVTDIRETLGIVWRRKLLIVGTMALVALGAVAYSAGRPRVYTAKSRLVVRPVVQQQGFSPSGSNSSPLGRDISIESQAEILKSPVVAQRVQSALGSQAAAGALGRAISVRVVTDELLEIVATARSPQHSANLANTFADEYIQYRKEEARVALEQVAQDIENQLAGLAGKVEPIEQAILERKIEVTRVRLELAPSVKRATSVQRLNQEIRGLEADRNELVVQRGVLRVRLEEVRANLIGTIGGGQIVQPATRPVAASSPKPEQDGIVGLVVGLVLGLVLALVRHRFDDRLRSARDAALAAGVPVLGTVARARRLRRKKGPILVTLNEPGAQATESYRSLRQSLTAIGVGSTVSSVLLTSGGDRAGKTETVANLAVAFAQGGYRVVAVCADLRGPRLHEYFNLSNEGGLADVLSGERSVADVLQPTMVEGLAVLPSGKPRRNTGALLDGKRLTAVFAELEGMAEVIIVDSPAMSSGADALVLAPRTDVALLVMRFEHATGNGANAGVRALHQAGAARIGAVMTAVPGGTRMLDRGFGTETLDSQAQGWPATNGHRRAEAAGSLPFTMSEALAPQPLAEPPSPRPRTTRPRKTNANGRATPARRVATVDTDPA